MGTAERIEPVKCPKCNHVFNAWEHRIDGETRDEFLREREQQQQARINEAVSREVDAIQQKNDAEIRERNAKIKQLEDDKKRNNKLLAKLEQEARSQYVRASRTTVQLNGKLQEIRTEEVLKKMFLDDDIARTRARGADVL